jgi:hypothetical protein
MDQNARLAAARAGENERVSERRRDRFTLPLVQGVQDVGNIQE